MNFDAPYRHDPNHPMNPPQAGVKRSIPVDLGNGVIEFMDEGSLERREGAFENEDEVTAWVEYRLPGGLAPVHRSAHVHLKKAMVFADATAAAIG